MGEPYTDEEKSLARVLGTHVGVVRVSRYAQRLEAELHKKYVMAEVKVGKVYQGPNSEPRVELSLSTDAAELLSTILENNVSDLKEVIALIEEWAHRDGTTDFETCSGIHAYLKSKGCIDD